MTQDLHGPFGPVVRCACALVVLGTSLASADITFATLAFSGQPVPGLANVLFSTFLGEGDGPPVIDNGGNVAFRARLAGTSVTPNNDTVIIRFGSSGPRVWLREGQSLPGGPVIGDCAAWPSSSPVVAGGRVWARNAGGGGASIVHGELIAEARLLTTGAPVPGIPPPVEQRDVGAFVAGEQGQVACRIRLSEAPGSAILSTYGSSMCPLVVEGEFIPNSSTDTFAWLGPCTLSAGGDVAFSAVTDLGVQAVYAQVLGDLAPIVRTGQVLPGGLMLLHLLDRSMAPSYSHSGRMVCRAQTDTSPAAIVSNRSGTWGVVAYSMMPFPGDPHWSFGHLGNAVRPLINEQDDIAFVAPLVSGGESRRGAFVSRGAAGFEIIALEGDPLPGAEGVSIVGIEPWTLRLNAQGAVVFAATLAGAGVTPDNNRALLAGSATGDLYTIVREGDPYDVFADGSTVRTVAAIGFANATGSIACGSNNDSGSGCFNDAGSVAFLLRFTDASEGVFTATIDTSEDCDADVNCDGVGDQSDIACIVLAVAGSRVCFCQADPDINRDGVADQGDVADLILIVAGAPCP